jgi:outer membrane protein OmpA-like peptidoglycan-associated protein
MGTGVRALVALALLAGASTEAAADEIQAGFWLGPRVYSDDSRLGYLETEMFHPTLDNSIAFGLRIARPFFPWLIPEFELAVAPTKTKPTGGAMADDVFWVDPRIHLRIEPFPGKRIIPFFVVGGGAPISISSAPGRFGTGITGDGYVGGGVRFDTGKGFAIRADARVAFLPGIDKIVTLEVDVGVGLELQFGRTKQVTGKGTVVADKPADQDDDGIPDAGDKCVDRAEDADGYEDLDGCPDIDNDLDRVLDVADKCSSVPEAYNGFEDDDGCPDTVPPEVDGLRGTVEGLLYADGETAVRDSAQPNLQKIVDIMKAHPSIKVILIGHSDDQEAKQFAEPVEGQATPNLATLSLDLSRARAEAVKQAMVSLGALATKIDVEGRGAEEPVSDNDKPRGRLANRRVEIKLYVPQSAR